MDLGSVVAQAAEVLSKPNQGFWKSQVQSPAKDDFQDSFVLPFVIGCGILICLPYLRYGIVPALMMGLLSGGFLWGLPYAMTWFSDSVATGMEGVGYRRETLHLWALVQVPLALGLVLGAITEPFVSMQVLAMGGLGYTIYLGTLFLPELHRVPGAKRTGFLVAIGVGLTVAFFVERVFLEEVIRAMLMSRFQNAL